MKNELVFGDLVGYLKKGLEIDVIDAKTKRMIAVYSRDEVVPLETEFRFRTIDIIDVENNVLKIYLNKY